MADDNFAIAPRVGIRSYLQSPEIRGFLHFVWVETAGLRSRRERARLIQKLAIALCAARFGGEWRL